MKLFGFFSFVLVFCVDFFGRIQTTDLDEKYRQLRITLDNPQLIRLFGFESTTHTVKTTDSFLLNLTRIVNPLNQKFSGYPLIFFSGLTEDSSIYLGSTDSYLNKSTGIYEEYENNFQQILQVNCADRIGRSLPLTLSYCGYDIWLAERRDNPYQARNLFLEQDDPEYWRNMNLDAYMEDTRSYIEYVTNFTGFKTVGIVCDSISCTNMIQLMSTEIRFNQIIRPLFAIGPVVWFSHSLSYLFKLIGLIEPITRNLLIPTPDIAHILASKQNPIGSSIIKLIIFSAFGGNIHEYEPERAYQFIRSIFLPVGARVLAHAGQRYNGQQLYRYDYGPEENLFRYGNITPPIYDYRKVTNPNIVMFSGTFDKVLSEIDARIFSENIPVKESIQLPYGHIDFTFARTVNVTVVKRFLQILEQLT